MTKGQYIQLSAEAREGTGKGVARALRREKQVPAVIYGGQKAPVSITMRENEIVKEYHKGGFFNNLAEIHVGKDKHLVLARDVQVNPVSGQILHADFLRVTSKTRIDVAIPVEFINEDKCKGLSRGGTLNVVRFDVELSCSATNIPEKLEIDLSDFVLGDAIKISHANLPEGTTPTITDRDFTIASIVAPRGGNDDEGEGEADAEAGAEAGEGDAAEGEAASE